MAFRTKWTFRKPSIRIMETLKESLEDSKGWNSKVKVLLCESLFETFVLHNNDLSLLLELVNLLKLVCECVCVCVCLPVWVVSNIASCCRFNDREQQCVWWWLATAAFSQTSSASRLVTSDWLLIREITPVPKTCMTIAWFGWQNYRSSQHVPTT